jgi:hypothetical protein
MVSYRLRAATRRQRMKVVLITCEAVAPSGLDHFRWFVTQGSQSLALGLTLIAAPQLSPLRYDHGSLSRNSNQTSGCKVLLANCPKGPNQGSQL